MRSGKSTILTSVFAFCVTLLAAGDLSHSRSLQQVRRSGGGRAVPGQDSRLIQPADLEYLGAFRLPGPSGGSNWEYSGYATAFRPDGDPDGPADGYPGSLFVVGHDHHQMVAEIAIPVPVVSAAKNPGQLNTATTLQPFRDITGGMFGELEIPRAGLAVLPPQDEQTTAKLHFCWGQHLQEFDPSHGWSELDLAHPNPAGPWKFGGFTNFATNDYIFPIAAEWASEHTPGQLLATGRFRDGHWSGMGPALFAYGPWADGNPPPPNRRLQNLTPLLLYGVQVPGDPNLSVSDSTRMDGFGEADEWSGGAWLTADERSAVILVGTKATGRNWYGFSNGVEFPVDGTGEGEEYPEVPDWPHDSRGWWSEDIEAQIIFFDPGDLAAVAGSDMESWEPQPYASLSINEHLFDPGFNHERDKRYLLGGAAFDRAHGVLYIVERRADADEKALIHGWRIAGSGGG